MNDLLMLNHANIIHRLTTCIQPHTCNSTDRPPSNGNDAVMGPIEIASSLSIPGQANATADPNVTLQSRNNIRVNGELPTIWQGKSSESRNGWK